MSVPAFVAHDTPNRLRMRLASPVSLTDLRVRLDLLPGVTRVRILDSIRSVTVHHDGRRATRDAILKLVERMLRRPTEKASGHRGQRLVRPSLPALAAAAIPLAPQATRPALAIALLAVRTATRPGQDRFRTGALLDTLSLAGTALTGHPITASTSILLGSIAEEWRDRLLGDVDALLDHLSPPAAETYLRQNVPATGVPAEELRIGDVLRLESGQVVPADGLVTAGEARIAPVTRHEHPAGRRITAGRRLASGQRLTEGAVTFVVERSAARSRAKRLREHVRHTQRTRDATQTGITPDLDRLATLPVTSAGLVLAMTGDASRTAAMLQADPQQGLLLAHPVAREASVYALAREGVLASGLETVERLAGGTVLALEDIGILTHRDWHIAELRSRGGRLQRSTVEGWLGRLAGVNGIAAHRAGYSDRQVSDWLEHGSVLSDRERVLHIGGAEPLRRTWNLEITHPDRGSLERVLGIVEHGRLLGSVKLTCRLRRDAKRQLRTLRRLGFKRIAILTEDLEERAGRELEALGADTIVSRSREAQGQWLEEAVERDERIVLLHTGLRDLLPPGGLSLCPVEAEAGAHGVVLGEPLSSLISARAVAQTVRSQLRFHFGWSTAANGALMVASGLALITPIVNTTLHHASALLLLRSSAGLASPNRGWRRVNAGTNSDSVMEEE